MGKKRKRDPDNNVGHTTGVAIDTSKPTARYTPTGGRSRTVSVALPGSIIANAQSHDAKTHLAGTIARALAVYCIDEIIIFEDDPRFTQTQSQNGSSSSSASTSIPDDVYTATTHPSHFLAHILSYLETPPHLRRVLFPMHPNLRTAGTLPSLDMPHHLRANETCEFREGVSTSVVRVEGPAGEKKTEVDVGLLSKVSIKGMLIDPGTRVTIRLADPKTGGDAMAVGPATPRVEMGYYWGYSVRRTKSLSGVFTECPYPEGYDVSIGMSERGKSISETLNDLRGSSSSQSPKSEHLLIVFGGVAGLEAAATADPELGSKGITAASVGELFDHWVNVLPGQGSRTIRTEEALWMGLMGLSEIFHPGAGG